VLLAFISAVSDPNMNSVLTAVQLLWVNLIMDTFAALALATDPPTEKILDQKPQPKSAPLITTNMWKMIIGQSIFQLTVTLILYFAGDKILGLDTSDSNQNLQLSTIVFNTFVWMQIFNEFNNRRLDNKFNIFEGVHRNKFFIVINCIMVGAQVAIVFVGGSAFSITPLNGIQWAICLVLALLSLPWAVAIRLVPDEWFARAVSVITRPFLMVYRPFRRFFSKLGSSFKGVSRKIYETLKQKVKKRSSKDEKEKESGAEKESNTTTLALVVSEAPPPPMINIEDVEKGRS
jgi:P-type Ca2+ transporter type 2C